MPNGFGVFFDLDGTLVDNEHLEALAFSTAMERLGGRSHPSPGPIVPVGDGPYQRGETS